MPSAKRQMTRATGGRSKANSKSSDSKKELTNAQVVRYQSEILDMLSQMTESDAIDVLYRAGVGSRYCTCQMCGKVRPISSFYKINDIKVRTGYSSICSECAISIADGIDSFGNAHGYSKASLCTALEYIDKPFIENVYDDAVMLYNDNSKKTANKHILTIYLATLNSNKIYSTHRWKDSDHLSNKFAGYSTVIEDTEVETSEEDVIENQEQYEINRRDTIKFCGYDPFINEAERDKPRLYAKLVGFLDDQAKEDPFKLSSIIEIVKGLAQSEKLNDEITALLNDKATLIDNNAVLNKLMDTRKKCLDTVQTLARDNGISINYNKNSSAGQQTLSGRIKKVTEENLREGRVNLFDIGTCAGMQQIAEISEAARAKQLGFNEDIAREIKDTSTALVTGLTKERDEYKERCRILLRENLDLKEFLRDKDLIDEHNVAISDE